MESCPNSFYAVSVVGRQEYAAALMLRAKVEGSSIRDVYAIVVPPDLPNTIFLETVNYPAAIRVTSGVRFVKSVMRGKAQFGDVAKLVKREKPMPQIEVGDEVEIVAGPLRGHRGRVESIDPETGEVIVRLYDTMMDARVYIREIRKAR